MFGVKSLIVIALCYLSIVSAQHEDHQTRIQVAVYYESLCPDSKAFITKQLTPALQGNLSHYVDLQLIPYGKSSQSVSTGNLEFTCHHGPKECYGNKIHACGLNLIQNDAEDMGVNRTSLGFVTCLMEKAVNDGQIATYPIKECAENNKVRQLSKIENCVNHTDGSAMLSVYGKQTHDLLNGDLKSVPTVVFQRKYNADESKEAQESFIRVLCRYIQGEKPADCANSVPTHTLSMLALMLVVVKQLLF